MFCCGRLSSVDKPFLRFSKPGECLPSEGTWVLPSSSIPSVSSTPQSWRPSSDVVPMSSLPSSCEESRLDLSEAVSKTVVGIPITEGVESLKENSNPKTKEDFDRGSSYSNPKVHSVSNRFFNQDFERLVLEEFQV